MKNNLTVAAIQLNPGSTVSENIRGAVDWIERAHSQGAGLIVLPELFIYRGTPRYYPYIAEPIGGPLTTFFSSLAKHLGVHLILGSIVEKSSHPHKWYDTTLCISSSGTIVAQYRKINLFEVHLRGKSIKESAYFLNGHTVRSYTCAGHTVGIAICFDVRFPNLFHTLASRKVELICIPSNFTNQTGRAHWHVLLRNRAIETQSFIIAANCCGIDRSTRVRSFGHSIIIDPWGTILAEAGDGETCIQSHLDFEYLHSIRKKLPLRA